MIVVLAVAIERLAELVLARRNVARLRARGAVEVGAAHYPWMVALHAALLVGSAVEPLVTGRAGAPVALVGVVLAQALRWWCVVNLGGRWTTRVLVLRDAPRVRTGPYRWMRHPNYFAVFVEGFALPAFTGAWLTAAAFTALNGALLRERIRVEDAALGAG